MIKPGVLPLPDERLLGSRRELLRALLREALGRVSLKRPEPARSATRAKQGPRWWPPSIQGHRCAGGRDLAPCGRLANSPALDWPSPASAGSCTGGTSGPPATGDRPNRLCVAAHDRKGRRPGCEPGRLRACFGREETGVRRRQGRGGGRRAMRARADRPPGRSPMDGRLSACPSAVPLGTRRPLRRRSDRQPDDIELSKAIVRCGAHGVPRAVEDSRRWLGRGCVRLRRIGTRLRSGRQLALSPSSVPGVSGDAYGRACLSSVKQLGPVLARRGGAVSARAVEGTAPLVGHRASGGRPWTSRSYLAGPPSTGVHERITASAACPCRDLRRDRAAGA